MIKISPPAACFLRQIQAQSELSSFVSRASIILLTGNLPQLQKEEREKLADSLENNCFGPVTIPENLQPEFKIISQGLRSFRSPQERERIKRQIRLSEE